MGTFLLVNINYILSFAYIDAVVHCNVPDVWEFGPLGLCLSPGRQWTPNCAYQWFWSTVIALAGRVRGRRLRVLIDSGSTGHYLNAQCQTALDLEVKPKEDFEQLMLAHGSEVHAQGYA